MFFLKDKGNTTIDYTNHAIKHVSINGVLVDTTKSKAAQLAKLWRLENPILINHGIFGDITIGNPLTPFSMPDPDGLSPQKRGLSVENYTKNMCWASVQHHFF